MKIAISTNGSTLDAEVDPRFGRCQYFIVADPETMEFEAINNSSAMAGGGAGISAAQMVANKGVKAVLTGNCGPNAYQVLSSAGIQVITGVSGSVKDAIEGYRSGKFQTSASANVPDHFGMGWSRGGGKRMGGSAMSQVGANPSPASQEHELVNLDKQIKMLKQQLETVMERIKKLESR